MTTTVDTQSSTNKQDGNEQDIAAEQYTVESLAIAIKALSFKDKERLLDMIEQQIFEEEEDNCVETEESIAAVKAAKEAYEAGDYVTYDEYLANRSVQTL